MTHYHLIGIGGTGLSAIARVLLQQGHTVSGSDRALSPLAKSLEADGVRVIIGHNAENILGADQVIRSSAVTDDNPEVIAAHSSGIPVLKRADALGNIINGKRCIAIAGTHGKTTTTGMIAWMLTALKLDPSYIVGSNLANLGTNAHAGTGRDFVIEADEYDRMFLGLHPQVIVLTHLEYDHPDCFPTWASYQEAFQQFANQLDQTGALLVNGDNPSAASIVKNNHLGSHAGKRYGLYSDSEYQARGLAQNELGGFTFVARKKENSNCSIPLGQVALQVPGEHNVLNALAAMAVASELGMDTLEASRALGEFQGTSRRFEVRGKPFGISIIDDYAHHPTEIMATLAAARSRYPNSRIWAVWQPHTYSRTRSLYKEFSQAFQDADQVIISNVYPAREPYEEFPVEDLVKAMHHPAARYIPTLDDISSLLENELMPGDTLLVLSAGDADQVSSQVLANLEKREAQS